MGVHAVAARSHRLRVDPLACDGVGICAHLAPETVTVDMWGYPIIAPAALDGRQLRRAEAAVAACPHRALFVERGAAT